LVALSQQTESKSAAIGIHVDLHDNAVEVHRSRCRVSTALPCCHCASGCSRDSFS